MNRRFVQGLIIFLVFPVLVVGFHQFAFLPTLLLYPLISYFGLPIGTSGTVLSIAFLLPAVWFAILLCKMIWPRTDQSE
jgi:hypothetical protein